MRIVILLFALITTSCGQAATDFGWNDFYLNCSDQSGAPRKTFYVDLGRKQISVLHETGKYYLVCDGCEQIISDTTLKWSINLQEGGQDVTTIDRRTGKYWSQVINHYAPPSYIGGVAVPAHLMPGSGQALTCERADGPPETKF